MNIAPFDRLRGPGQVMGRGKVPQERDIWKDEIQPSPFVGRTRNKSERVIINDDSITVDGADGTVIIDGSSNMFKILATGTLDATAANPGSPPSAYSEATDTVILSGLGTFTATPGCIAFVGSDFLTTDERILGLMFTVVSVDEHDIIGMKTTARVSSFLTGANLAKINLTVRNFIGGSTSRGTARYHLVQEAAF